MICEQEKVDIPSTVGWGGGGYLANLDLLSAGGPISNVFPSVSTNADKKTLSTFQARCLHLETCLPCWEDAARVTSGSVRPSKQTRQPPRVRGKKSLKVMRSKVWGGGSGCSSRQCEDQHREEKRSSSPKQAKGKSPVRSIGSICCQIIMPLPTALPASLFTVLIKVIIHVTNLFVQAHERQTPPTARVAAGFSSRCMRGHGRRTRVQTRSRSWQLLQMSISGSFNMSE